METTKTNLKGFQIFALLSLVCGLGTIVFSCISLGTMGEVYGMAPGIGDIITYFYQIHGFFALFLALLAISFLFMHGRKRETLAKVAVWGMLILALMHVTPFFTETIFYLTSISFGAGLNYFSAYIPAVMIAIVAIAMLSDWTNSDPYMVNRIALVCSLISIFMCIVYLVQASTMLSLTSTLHDNAQIWGLICGNLGVTFSCVFIWGLTSSRRRFERLMYDMTETEAMAFEIVEDRVEVASRRIEAEVDAELGTSHSYMAPDEYRDIPPERPAAPPVEPQAPPRTAPVRQAPTPMPTPAPAPEPAEETRRGRFIPASENLYGELPLQSRPKGSSAAKSDEEW